MQQNIVILGSTGSIGTQTLEVIRHLNHSTANTYDVVALSCGTNISLLADQVKEFNPRYVAVKRADQLDDARRRLPEQVEILTGTEGLKELVSTPRVDTVINALVGFVGLEPSLQAAKNGHKILLANKESLVVGGHLVTEALEANEGELIPIDSEHSAIFQALRSGTDEEIDRIIITASGGPFRETSPDQIPRATPDEALDHPNWSMGKRITCDSATMVNKGFEVIEAHWLFDLPFSQIDTVIHPQSIIHSMVEFCDGSVLAQMGPPDMRGPIQYALTHPRRENSDFHRLDLVKNSQLSFAPVDEDRYPAFKTLIEAGKQGGNKPAALNSADEELIEAFLRNEIKFGGIARGLRKIFDEVEPIENPTLNQLKITDRWVREKIRQLVTDDLLKIN